jgi:peptide/nickel transport system substrate-binding protein
LPAPVHVETGGHMLTSSRSVALAGLLAAAASSAQTFRYASSGDILTLDPHSANEALTNSFKMNLYEGLTRWGRDLRPEAALAESWTN